MNALPLTREVLAEIDECARLANGPVNGRPISNQEAYRVYLLLAQLRYGRAGRCPSSLYHGPGHQSRCDCELAPDHEGPHRARVAAVEARWNGLVAFTSYFDELPDLEEEETS